MNERSDTTPHPADRLPPLPDSALSPAQREVVARVQAGPRGAVFGPFVPLLRSPAAMTSLQELGSYLRFESPLPRAIFEMAVLLIARAHDQEFEWAYHAPLARAAGLPQSVIDAIARNDEPRDLPGDERAAYRLVMELVHTNRVGDATYRDATVRFGEQSVVDLVVTLGYYATLAMVMNLAQTPAPIPSTDILPTKRTAPQ